MNIFKCYLCGFETQKKSQIHFHHIIPKEARPEKISGKI